MALKSDSIIEHVLEDLDRPKHYVGGILNNLKKCAAIHGNGEVIIGTSGSGKRPYYRIVHFTAGKYEIFDTFFDNHISFSKEGLPATGETPKK